MAQKFNDLLKIIVTTVHEKDESCKDTESLKTSLDTLDPQDETFIKQWYDEMKPFFKKCQNMNERNKSFPQICKSSTILKKIHLLSKWKPLFDETEQDTFWLYINKFNETSCNFVEGVPDLKEMLSGGGQLDKFLEDDQIKQAMGIDDDGKLNVKDLLSKINQVPGIDQYIGMASEIIKNNPNLLGQMDISKSNMMGELMKKSH